MFYWSLFFGSIGYTIMGIFGIRITHNYLNELVDKVATIDIRYCDRLYLYCSDFWTRHKQLFKVIVLILWPVYCIATILKAEWEYDIIRNSYKGACR